MLGNYIDFKSIQHSLKVQLKTELILKAGEHKKESGLSRDLLIAEVADAGRLLEDFIDSFVSTAGLTRLFLIDSSTSGQSQLIDARKHVSVLQSDKFIGMGDIEYHSFMTVRLKGVSVSGKSHQFVFTFRYLRWVLTDIIVDLTDVDNNKVINFINKFQLVKELS